MIGNDIVDLAQTNRESNWQRKGFLNKLFTSEEQSLIYQSTEPERMVWILWSMKESVYKVSVRKTGKRVFAPQKIACQITSLTEEMAAGTVLYEKPYQTKSVITQHYIASVAFPENSSTAFQHLIIPFASRDYQSQSATVRGKLVEYCADVLAIPAEMICVNKDQQGIPSVIINNASKRIITIPLSISHHGYYGAYVIGFPSPKHC